MKLTIPRDTLRAAVDAAKPATGRSTLNLTEYLLLTAEGPRLTVTGTDLALRLVSSCEAEISSYGRICVPARAFSNLLKNLPAGDVELSADETRLTVRYGRGRTTLHCLAPEYFPKAPITTGARSLEIPPATLHGLLSAVLPAVCTDETRYHLAGVFFEVRENRLTCVSTDGHRLHYTSAPICEGPDLAVTVPKKAAHALRAAIQRETEPVTLTVGEKYLSLALSSLSLSSQLVDGTFPDWRQVVPKESPHLVTVRAEALLTAIKRALPLADDRNYGLTLESAEEGLCVALENVDTGEYRETLDAEGSVPARTVLNARYLREAVEAVGAEEVVLGFSDPESPVVVRSEAGEAGPVCVCMPMRI